MKIGIVTLPLHANYGGILQVYALQTVLERMGHRVALIDRTLYWGAGPVRRTLVYANRLLKMALGKKIDFFRERKADELRRIPRQYTDIFIRKHIHRRSVVLYSQVRRRDYDALVVGSDQVWRPLYFENTIGNAFLAFAEGWKIGRIAYAASFGTDTWEYTPEETEECSRLAKSFDAVSVREESGIALCRKYLGVDAVQTLDPTLLLQKDDYDALIDTCPAEARCSGTPAEAGCSGSPAGTNDFRISAAPDVSKAPAVVCYILDRSPEKMAVARNLSESLGMEAVSINSRYEDHSAPAEERIQPPVEYWLRSIRDAGFVLTDSFHACVFSIIFRKPFAVIGNEGRGMARFTSLLSEMGLTDRLIRPDISAEALASLAKSAIDYDAVHAALAKLQRESLSFLETALAKVRSL